MTQTPLTNIYTKKHYHRENKPCPICEKKCPACKADFTIEGDQPFRIQGEKVFCVRCGQELHHLRAETIPVIQDKIQKVDA